MKMKPKKSICNNTNRNNDNSNIVSGDNITRKFLIEIILLILKNSIRLIIAIISTNIHVGLLILIIIFISIFILILNLLLILIGLQIKLSFIIIF